jgi:hypothetical protein
MEVRPAATPAAGAREALLWAVTTLAFSPILVDLARHALEQPWALYPLAFWLLFARETARAERTAPRMSAGMVLIVFGLVLELLMLRADWPRMARPGWLAAAFGVCLLVGRPSLRAASLILWWIPVPHALATLASPALETWLATPAAWLLELSGAAVRLELVRREVFLQLADATLPIRGADAGIPLAALLAGLGWHDALRRGSSLASGVRRAGLCGLLALPLQIAFIGLAAGLAALGAPDAGRAWLDGCVPVTAALGLLRGLRLRGPTDRYSSASHESD